MALDEGLGLQGDCHWTQHIVLGSQSQKLNISSHYHKSGNTHNIKGIRQFRSEVGCEGDWNGFVILISTI